jgi:hypothetical protein
MANAVEEWFRIKDEPNAPSNAAFARQKQLKPDTFKKYVHDVPEKRQNLGCHAGLPSLLSESNSQFLMQHTIQADRANNGLTPAQIIENMTTLQPELSQQHSRNHYHCTFIKKHADVEAKASQGSKNYIKAKSMYCRPAIQMVQIILKGSLLPTNQKHRSM